MEHKNDYTGLLYSEPSFLEGFGRVLDIGGTSDEYNESLTADEADYIAIASDWSAVGADLYRSIQRFVGNQSLREAVDGRAD